MSERPNPKTPALITQINLEVIGMEMTLVSWESPVVTGPVAWINPREWVAISHPEAVQRTGACPMRWITHDR